MCGRATLTTPADELAEIFDLDEVPLLRPHYNIAPSQEMAVVRTLPEHAARRLDLLRWGLVPWWAEDEKVGHRFINARSDTLLASRAFREAARERRCIVVVDGFYEWRKVGKHRYPYFVQRRDHEPLALAGLWEKWRPRGAERPRLETCTVITTDAQPSIAELHDRMPLILPPEQWDAWLDPSRTDADAIAPLLARHDADLTVRPVSTYVNSPEHDDARCLDEVPEPTLFPL